MKVLKWDMHGELDSKVMDLETPVLAMDFYPSGKGAQQQFALACSDGSFKIVSKTGRVEKNIVEAHQTAIIGIKWSYEGAALATCGEDGQIKIWSKNGSHRSTLVQGGKPIYALSWNPENDHILFASDKTLTIAPTLPTSKQNSWKAHDGVVLACDWNPANNRIVSSGEDARYRVWDAYGRQLYSSLPYDHVITSVKWSPNGEVFAVGAFEMLRLCDKSGWSYSFHKPKCGSILGLSWNHDGNLVAGAGGNGAITFNYIVDRQISWAHIEATLDQDNKIQVNDSLNEMDEDLDFRDRVVNMSMKHSHLVVCTTA
jgi:intraflagellar transport protein 80